MMILWAGGVSIICSIALAFMHFYPLKKNKDGRLDGVTIRDWSESRWVKRRGVSLQEVFLPLIIIPVIFLVKYTTETLQTQDVEYWGGYVTSATFTEEWNEKVSCRHPKYCTDHRTCKDSNGRSYDCSSRYQCGNEHAYDVDHHPNQWVMEDSNGKDHGISQGRYRELVARFGNETFVEMNRRFHTIDGDAYKTVYPYEDREKAVVIVTDHTYENRVAVSDSIFNYQEVKPEDRKDIFEYPQIAGLYAPALLVKGNHKFISDPKEATRNLDYINAFLGRAKQVRVWVLVFPVGTSLEVAKKQEAYWKGGNKNELVICVSPKEDGSLAWVSVFSWMKSTELGIEIREHLMQEFEKKPLNFQEFGNWLYGKVEKQFVRKPFAEFSYITVEPPLPVVITVWIVTILLNCVIVCVVRNN
jgi:hypothetical protein